MTEQPENLVPNPEAQEAAEKGLEVLPADEAPTFEQLTATIRRLTTKIDELTETKRILKKQADALWRKL